MGRTARGVKAIALNEGDEVVSMVTVTDGERLLTVTEDGKGRLTDFDQYRTQYRGGRGVCNYHPNRGRKVAGVKAVDETNDVIIISQSGVIIKIPVDGIAAQSRYGGGVNVMRLDDEDKVVTVARALRDGEGVDDAAAEKAESEPELTEDDSAGVIKNKEELDQFIEKIAEETAAMDGIDGGDLDEI